MQTTITIQEQLDKLNGRLSEYFELMRVIRNIQKIQGDKILDLQRVIDKLEAMNRDNKRGTN